MHHILIYGVPCYSYPEIEPHGPFKEHYMPIYGDPIGGTKFIGHEYGRIHGLYENPIKVDAGGISITLAEPSEQIKEKFKALYPGATPGCYALIQNVRNHHYASGGIVYGYGIGHDDCDPYEICDIFNRNSIDGIELINVSGGHNMNDSFELFLGVEIALFPGLEDEDDCADLVKLMRDIHRPIPIPSRAELLDRIAAVKDGDKLTLSEYPVLTTVQYMCYCCT